MKDKPLDLSALATNADPERWSQLLDETVAQSRVIAEQYQSSATPLDYLLLWSRPALSAALVLIALSLAALGRDLTTVPVPHGAAGLATIARVWAAGGPPPSGAALGDVVEAPRP